MSFTNKVAIITGAGSGIGEAIAIHFAKLSARLSLIDINTENLAGVAENCKHLSETEVLTAAIDISKDEDLKQAVCRTVGKYGRIDIVVNCAGVFASSRILDSDTIAVFDRVINVNLRSMVTMTHYTAPMLIKSKGCIVNIASVMAQIVSKDSIAYNISKAGVVHFTRCIALELADKGVRVNCICPGPVKTNIILNMGSSQDENDIFWKKFAKTVPLQSNADPEEIANMVGYLASDKAKSITGADFVIDSGLSLSGI